MSAYGLNLPQDPLESNVEEVIEGEEEEISEEYDSDSDLSRRMTTRKVIMRCLPF